MSTARPEAQERRSENLRLYELLIEHKREEVERYAEILRKIDANKEAADQRSGLLSEQMRHLADSITAFIDRTTEFHADVKRAFPKDEDGVPAYDEHRIMHQAQRDGENTRRDIVQHTKKVIVASVAISVLVTTCTVLWHLFSQAVVTEAASKLKIEARHGNNSTE